MLVSLPAISLTRNASHVDLGTNSGTLRDCYGSMRSNTGVARDIHGNLDENRLHAIIRDARQNVGTNRGTMRDLYG